MKYLRTILEFPTPRNITDARFGLVNQVSYAFSTAEKMLPLRELLQQGTPFRWTDELKNVFEDSKAVVVSEIEEAVQIFDRSKPTCLAADRCQTGIGFWLHKCTAW